MSENSHIQNHEKSKPPGMVEDSHSPKPLSDTKNKCQKWKSTGHKRLSLNCKSVSFSPSQGFTQTQSCKKHSNDYRLNDYFVNYAGISGKQTLPNDSWHFQMQMQSTYKESSELGRTLDLDLDTFKTDKCTIQAKHNPKHCIYFHSLKDRRRPGSHYSTDLCRYAETDKCIKGDK